jgi:hypothetical protein
MVRANPVPPRQHHVANRCVPERRRCRPVLIMYLPHEASSSPLTPARALESVQYCFAATPPVCRRPPSRASLAPPGGEAPSSVSPPTPGRTAPRALRGGARAVLEDASTIEEQAFRGSWQPARSTGSDHPRSPREDVDANVYDKRSSSVRRVLLPQFWVGDGWAASLPRRPRRRRISRRAFR